jgi:hypothetical protein
MKKQNKIENVHRGGCPCCPRTEDTLQPETVLYNGFGGYHVERNGEIFYCGGVNENWTEYKTLWQIEEEIQKIENGDSDVWKVILNNPLRGATWERKEKDIWVLTETNLGFA